MSNPEITITVDLWNQLAEDLNFDPNVGIDFRKAKLMWEDYEEDYQALFGQESREAEAAKQFIENIVPSWRTMLLNTGLKGTLNELKLVAADNNIKLFISEEASQLAFAWLQRAIKTRHGSIHFPIVKKSIRALLSSEPFWKGLGCRGNAWSLEGDLFDDTEWADFRKICTNELAKIGDKFKTFYESAKLGHLLGDLGDDIGNKNLLSRAVRQPFQPCPNLKLRGPGEKFLNDGTGEDQYIFHITLLSHAFNYPFEQKVAKAIGLAMGTNTGSKTPTIIQHKAPVKSMLRMAAKLRYHDFCTSNIARHAVSQVY